jgi:hypothetical protein
MAPILNLDFSTSAFLTDDDGEGHATVAKGIDSQPMRVAHDNNSNSPFVQVLENIPTTDLGSNPAAAKRRSIVDALLEAGKLVSVPGHGVWCSQADLQTVINTFKG